MATVADLTRRGVAEERHELVSLFRRPDGTVRADLWSQPGTPGPAEGEVELGDECGPCGAYYMRYSGPVVCVRLHWGRWIVAQEEIPRLVAAVKAKIRDQLVAA